MPERVLMSSAKWGMESCILHFLGVMLMVNAAAPAIRPAAGKSDTGKPASRRIPRADHAKSAAKPACKG